MRIDVHAHLRTDDYLDLLVDPGRTDAGTQRGIGAGGRDELDARLRLMDRAGLRHPCRSVEGDPRGQRGGAVEDPGLRPLTAGGEFG